MVLEKSLIFVFEKVWEPCLKHLSSDTVRELKSYWTIGNVINMSPSSFDLNQQR